MDSDRSPQASGNEEADSTQSPPDGTEGGMAASTLEPQVYPTEEELLTTPEQSGTRTPENWEQLYGKYLEDSPVPVSPAIKAHTYTYGETRVAQVPRPIVPPPPQSPATRERIDRSLSTMRRNAELFFAKTPFTRRERTPKEQMTVRRQMTVETQEEGVSGPRKRDRSPASRSEEEPGPCSGHRRVEESGPRKRDHGSSHQRDEESGPRKRDRSPREGSGLRIRDRSHSDQREYGLRRRDRSPVNHPGSPKQHSKQPDQEDRHWDRHGQKRHISSGHAGAEGPARKVPKSYQSCPARGCGAVSKYLKDHAFQAHIPNLFHELERPERRAANVQRQRLNALQQLAEMILGNGTTIEDLVDFVNRHLSGVIAGPTTIWGPSQGDMEALCNFAGWSMPERFEVFPTVNSPAALFYWRIMLYLLDQLQDQDRRELACSYNHGATGRVEGPRDKVRETFGRVQGPPSERRQESQRFEEPPSRDLPRQQSPYRLVGTGFQGGQLRVTIGTCPSQQTLSVREPSSKRAFDSHFHLDRTAIKLFARSDVANVQVEEILQHPILSPPKFPVDLVGGVMVFCDPERQFSIPLTEGKWKVAVGVHPRKALSCTEGIIQRIKSLLDSNSLVRALGEIGLDRTEPDYTWVEQDRWFRRLLRISRPDKVIVLHLRGAADYGSVDVIVAALHYAKKVCPPLQKFHLHCFTGYRDQVEDWLDDFPNTYFGFTAKVASFNLHQQEGLRSVPADRLLLETDSPYFQVDSNNFVNTPAYLGDVANLVARIRGVRLEDVLDVTLTNGLRLYH